MRSENIDTFEILSKQDAAAIFGVRGQNGAVFLYTKKRKKVDYFIAGLKRKSKRKDNFDQYKPGDIRINY